MLGCALLIGAFCLSGPGLHEVHGTDGARHVLESGDYSARIEQPVHVFDPVGSKRTCRHTACIAYRKHCERAHDKVACGWVFEHAQIVVTVDGTSDLRIALSEIEVRAGDGFVSLWQLD